MMKASVTQYGLLILLAFQGSAFAEERWADRNAKQSTPSLSKEQAVERVQQHTPGRVLSAEKSHEGQAAYRVKVLTHRGEVQVVYVDAQTGHVAR